MTKDFRYQHSHRLSETEHGELAALRPKDPGRRWINRLGLFALGIVCLFSPYTLIIGIALLGLGAFVLIMPRYMPLTAARTYRKLRYLHDPLEYGVSQDRIWIRGPDLHAEAAWRHLATWSEKGPWLILSPQSLPRLFLPIAGLKDAGVYEDVLAHARAHAPEFDSPKGRRAAL